MIGSGSEFDAFHLALLGLEDTLSNKLVSKYMNLVTTYITLICSATLLILTSHVLVAKTLTPGGEDSVIALEQADEPNKQVRMTSHLQDNSETDVGDKSLLLQRALLLAVICYLIFLGFLYLKHIHAKHSKEKLLIEKRYKEELENSYKIIEVKDKKATALALKLIEKETYIDEIKEKLSQGRGDMKRREIKQLVRSMTHGSKDSWKEFEASFVSINKEFYETLSQKYARLTQGDLKLCALIRLNFSSKDIAKLMGISVESVHTMRYRLRKKLDLTRDMNLKEFIAQV